MNFKSAAAAAAIVLGLGVGGAQAATISISGGTNDQQLQPDGSNNYVASGLLAAYSFLTEALFSVNGDAILTFTEVGAESGFTNSFTFRGNMITEERGQYTASTTSNWTNFIDGESFSVNVSDGDTLSDMLFSAAGGSTARNSQPGDFDFGVFFLGDQNSLTTFFLAYDDQAGLNNGTDDNHDDYIVRVDVTPVPLPAAGWMLLAGLGGMAAMRRFRKS